MQEALEGQFIEFLHEASGEFVDVPVRVLEFKQRMPDLFEEMRQIWADNQERKLRLVQ